MTRLKAESLTRVGSPRELLAIGHALKAEEANRYETLAQQISEMDNAPVAAIFQRFARAARETMATIEQQDPERRQAPLAAGHRTLPKIFDETSAEELASLQIATPYRALSLAVRIAERTFVFWSYLAAQAEGSEVRRVAEAAARQELDRAASLRQERRQAYHAEYPSARARTTRETQGAADTALPVLERRMADMLRRWANEAGEGASASLLHLAEEASAMAETPIAAHPSPSSISTATAELADKPLALAELLVERYLDAAEHQEDETAMARAQSLAARAIKRLAWLQFFKQRPRGQAQDELRPPKREDLA